jgi:mono/diheme cytochrome c family protein
MPKTALIMRSLGATGAAAAILLAVSFAMAARSDPQDFTQIERGRYLAVASDCASCHTVPGSGQPFAGGRAIETPFGNIVAPNITPDRETGIGAWSDDEFDAALRRGIGRDGSRLYPAMPYNAYTKMSRDDVLAIRTYLNTVTPVSNAVVANTLPFPFNIRAAMRVWDALYFTEGEYKPDPQKSPEWNRGAFLVDGPAHCGACHTPKSLLGGDRTSQYLQGSNLQGWFAPDITNDTRLGLGGWAINDVVAYLKTGHNRVTAATGPMAEEITLSSSRMSDADLKAIATYLKSLPGRQDASKPLPSDDPVMAAGGAIYRDQCSACHGLDGHGVPLLFPSMAESSMVRSDDPTTLIRIVLRGARSVATAAEPTAPGMPSYGWQLDDDQVAAVLSYVRNTWGAAAPALSTQDVARARSQLASRPD